MIVSHQSKQRLLKQAVHLNWLLGRERKVVLVNASLLIYPQHLFSHKLNVAFYSLWSIVSLVRHTVFWTILHRNISWDDQLLISSLFRMGTSLLNNDCIDNLIAWADIPSEKLFKLLCCTKLLKATWSLCLMLQKLLAKKNRWARFIKANLFSKQNALDKISNKNQLKYDNDIIWLW